MQPRPERSADEPREHAHVVFRGAEQGTQVVLSVLHALIFVIHLELAVGRPEHCRPEQLHRVVVLHRHSIFGLDLRASVRQGFPDIAAWLRSRRDDRPHSGRHVRVCARDVEVCDVRFALVLDSHERCRMARQLKAVRQRQRDRLKAELDLVALQRHEQGTGRGNRVDVAGVESCESRGIFVCQDLQHARHPEGLNRVDPRDPPPGDRTGHDIAVDEVRDVVLGRVLRAARHLRAAVNPADWLTDVVSRHDFRSIGSLRP